MTKILIVDDETDLREAIVMVIASVVKAEFLEAGSGNEAIAVLASGKHAIDAVVCDFNMPDGNGSTVVQFLNEKHPTIPFLLLSSDDPKKHAELLQGKNRSYLQKPFKNPELRASVEKMLEGCSNAEIGEQDYIPVSLSILRRVGSIACPLYIQIGEAKYVKVLHPGTAFDEEVCERFEKKSVSHLYVHKDQATGLLSEFREQAFTEMFFKSMRERSTEALNLSSSTLELIQMAAKSMGWNSEIINLGNENTKMIQNLVAAVPNINEVFDWFESSDHDLGVSTGILLSYFLAAITKRLGITDRRQLEVLSMAGFFHDMFLDDYQIRNQEKFIKALSLGTAVNRETVEQIKNHPMEVRSTLSRWEQCPPGLLELIEQHHELPDGSGFPKGIKGAEMHPLSGIFVVARECIEVFVRTRDKGVVREHLLSRAAIFSQEPTKKAYEAAIKMFAPH